MYQTGPFVSFQVQFEKLSLNLNETFPCSKTKYHKPSNIKEYGIIRLITRTLFTNFDYIVVRKQVLTVCTLYG